MSIKKITFTVFHTLEDEKGFVTVVPVTEPSQNALDMNVRAVYKRFCGREFEGYAREYTIW